MGRIAWSDAEAHDALTLTEEEFLARHPHRNHNGIRQRVEKALAGTGETYTQFRLRQAQERRAATERVSAPVTLKDDPTDADYEAFFDLLERADGAKAALSPTQDSTEFTAPDPALPVAFAYTGDWHCGAGGVRYDWLRRDLDIIRQTDGLYAIGMGDWLEGVNINTKAASALYSGLFNDGSFQEIYVVKRAEALIGKWVAILSGNHDEWIYRAAGITRMDQFAALLNAPHFSQGGGTVFVNVGAQRYVVGVRHNVTGNSHLNTTNAQRRAFDSWPEWDNCHVITCGHLHYNDLHVQPRRGKRCVYLRSGTYKLIDGYARDHGYVPEWGVPLTIFLPDEERVIAWRGDDFLEGVAYFDWLRRRYAEGERSA